MNHADRITEEKKKEIIKYYLTHKDNQTKDIVDSLNVSGNQVIKTMDRYFKSLLKNVHTETPEF